jgi:hypothetical protein
MTMTFPVQSIDISGITGFRGLDGKPAQTKLNILHNSHGGFVLVQPHKDYKDLPYGGHSVELELSHFPEIIEAFNTKEIPKDPFEPFYRTIFGPKGMMLGPRYIFAYFTKDYYSKSKTGILLEERFTYTFEEVPSKYVEQVGLTLEEMTQAYRLCQAYYTLF